MPPNGIPGGGLKPLGTKAGKKQAKPDPSPRHHDDACQGGYHIPQHQAQQQLAAVMGRLNQLSGGEPVDKFVQQRASTTAGAMALAKELQTSLWGTNRTSSTDTTSVLPSHHTHDPPSHTTTLDPKVYYESVPPSDWRPEPSDSYLSLYRRAYCKLMDLAVPPLVFGTMAMFATMMPMWLLLLCTPLTFLLITFCCLTRGAGMGPSEIGQSRLTVSLVLSFEVVLPCVYLVDVTPLLPELWASHCTLLMVNAAALTMHWWLIASNPGRLRPAPAKHEGDPADAMETAMGGPFGGGGAGGDENATYDANGTPYGTAKDVENASTDDGTKPTNNNSKHRGAHTHTTQHGDGETNIPPQLAALYSTCETCNITRPLRSRHCTTCNACIERQDHHCPAIHNCVGAGNVRVFAAWQMAVLLGQVMFLSLTMRCLWRQAYVLAQHRVAGGLPGVGAVWGQWGLAVAMHRPTALFAIAVACMTCGTLYLVFRFTYCICGNLTTAELLNKRKYAYLRDPEDGFCNRFDQGMTANCITFWTSGEKQWRAARAPALVAAQSAHIPPRVSITTLLRNWEEREALLHQARAEARRKREAWLLETYGGVKDGHMHEDKSQQDDARPCCSHGGHGHHQHHHGDDP